MFLGDPRVIKGLIQVKLNYYHPGLLRFPAEPLSSFPPFHLLVNVLTNENPVLESMIFLCDNLGFRAVGLDRYIGWPIYLADTDTDLSLSAN